MSPVKRRLILHFPGFEPLDAEAHRVRYARSAAQSGPLWNLKIEVGALKSGQPAPAFDIVGEAEASRTTSRLHLFDYAPLILGLGRRPLLTRIATGFASAARVVLEGGLTGYVRHGWRFALFFLFPFLMVSLALALCLGIAALLPVLGGTAWHLLWSLPLGFLLFGRVFLPFSRRWHVLHLFDDWVMALHLARLREPALRAWLAEAETALRGALAEEADEVVVTSHSMGSGLAALVLGRLLEADPDLLRGRRVVFLTLGGAILQSALLRSAKTLRASVGRIARTPEIDWIEVQCLNDPVHFYRSAVVAASGHADAPEARIALIRVKQMLTREHHRRIRVDALRIHRQYVMGSDKRSVFDFAALTAGPVPAAAFFDPPVIPAEETGTMRLAAPPAFQNPPAARSGGVTPSRSAEPQAPARLG